MEKRKLERFKLNLPASIRIDENGSGEQIEMTTRDVSSGGAYFLTDRLLPVGSPIRIELILDIDRIRMMTGKRALIHLTGKVVRSGTDGIGVTFGDYYRIKPAQQNGNVAAGASKIHMTYVAIIIGVVILVIAVWRTAKIEENDQGGHKKK